MRKRTEEVEPIMRRIVRCSWRCRRCRQVVGSENLAIYCARLPDVIKPGWFFASMTLLDHLRDCAGIDFSSPLRLQYGNDFLNHPHIYDWFNQFGVLETELTAEEELEQAGMS